VGRVAIEALEMFLIPARGGNWENIRRTQMVAGIASSLIVFAVGAILDFAVTVSPYQHGFNIHTVGVILMIVGAVGFLLSIVSNFMWGAGPRKHRTVIDDGQGNVVRREDSYTGI
jgi:hypothetical protein